MHLLARILADTNAGAMTDRLMYGADWFMVALHPEHEQFLDRYRTMCRERFGQDRTDGFLGGHALAFLGFDDASNANARRLHARYQRFAPDRVPAWLAHEAADTAGRERVVVASAPTSVG